MTPDLDSTIVISPDLLVSALGAEAVVLSERTGMYYGLNVLALRIWRALEKHEVLRSAYDEVLAEYDVEPERFRADFLGYIDELMTRRFIALTPPTSPLLD